jgi:hypothetical protein
MAKTVKKKPTAFNAGEMLSNWKLLNERIAVLSEEECGVLLDAEKKGQKRYTFLRRIYGRYNTLRASREHRELAQLAVV